MSFLLSGRKSVAYYLLLAAATASVYAQTSYVPQGNQYSIIGSFAGDQVYPHASVNSSGGYLVWEDNITDGSGWGISARRLDGTFSGINSTFRVNSGGTGDQELPKVALLKNGGAVVAWQGGKQSFQHIYARFFTGSGTFLTSDVTVNSLSTVYQMNPVVTVLTNGNAVIAYASYNQVAADSLQDIYFQRVATNGTKVGTEVLVNQFTSYHQRNPAIAALANGKFVLTWISEQQRSVGNTNGTATSVDVYGRIYNADGTAAGSEFLVSSNLDLSANPSVAASPDGGFAVAWSRNVITDAASSWDVAVRLFSNAGVGDSVKVVNNHTYGDQYAPSIAADGAGGSGYLITWTSMGQDGSREGIYGRFLNWNGTFAGAESRANTTTASQQIHPVVAADGNGRFLTAWAGFTTVGPGFDLYAQRYALSQQQLAAPGAPYVNVLSSNALAVSWPSVAGLDVVSYGVYADGAGSPTANITSNSWVMTGLAQSSTHSFTLDYLLSDGRRSPQSAATVNTTYSTLMYGGIPYDWMISYFGSDVFSWPTPSTDSDGDGVSNLQEFLGGTIPTNATSVLKQKLTSTPQGMFLQWNTEPGLMYQVQTSSNFNSWSNLGGPRFAAGHLDSMYVGGGSVGYYRIIRLR